MKFGYAIIFVENVAETVEFYEKAFALQRTMVTPMFAQMQTGDTALAFGAVENEKRELPIAFRENAPGLDPAGFQVSFVTDDVQAAYDRATRAGAVAVVAPHPMPWGQVISRVRDCNGVLVSIVSPFQPKTA